MKHSFIRHCVTTGGRLSGTLLFTAALSLLTLTRAYLRPGIPSGSGGCAIE